jgi:hypothetical protein
VGRDIDQCHGAGLHIHHTRTALVLLRRTMRRMFVLHLCGSAAAYVEVSLTDEIRINHHTQVSTRTFVFLYIFTGCIKLRHFWEGHAYLSRMSACLISEITQWILIKFGV